MFRFGRPTSVWPCCVLEVGKNNFTLKFLVNYSICPAYVRKPILLLRRHLICGRGHRKTLFKWLCIMLLYN